MPEWEQELQLLTLSRAHVNRRNLLVSSVKEGFIGKEFQPDRMLSALGLPEPCGSGVS